MPEGTGREVRVLEDVLGASVGRTASQVLANPGGVATLRLLGDAVKSPNEPGLRPFTPYVNHGVTIVAAAPPAEHAGPSDVWLAGPAEATFSRAPAFVREFAPGSSVEVTLGMPDACGVGIRGGLREPLYGHVTGLPDGFQPLIRALDHVEVIEYSSDVS
jgi:hypothetical protein